ncbi:MAG TPA: hypothetical protein VMS60_02200 [Solirubrobacterales bacterium]|nr:hypothetical protein [Solirubrobacterales bacterium]
MVVALATFAVLQTGGSSDSGPLNAIAEAAERTQEQPGGRALIHTVVSSPVQSESMTMTGEMAFSDDPERSQTTFTISRPGSDDSQAQMVTDGSVMYMRSDLLGSLPDGGAWMAMDLSFAEDLGPSLPGGTDAMGELELLEEVADDVEKLGKEEVRGVPTTRYRGTVKGSPLKIEAWIDGKGLVRRMQFVKSEPGGKGEDRKTTKMRIDYFDFKSVPEIDVPDSDEVYDATEFCRKRFVT